MSALIDGGREQMDVFSIHQSNEGIQSSHEPTTLPQILVYLSQYNIFTTRGDDKCLDSYTESSEPPHSQPSWLNL